MCVCVSAHVYRRYTIIYELLKHYYLLIKTYNFSDILILLMPRNSFFLCFF